MDADGRGQLCSATAQRKGENFKRQHDFEMQIK